MGCFVKKNVDVEKMDLYGIMLRKEQFYYSKKE